MINATPEQWDEVRAKMTAKKWVDLYKGPDWEPEDEPESVPEDTQTVTRTVPEDKVNSPSHYTQGGIEPIDYIEAKFTKEELRGYLWGSVIKYISRWPHKGKVEDLRKAKWFLERLIKAELEN